MKSDRGNFVFALVQPSHETLLPCGNPSNACLEREREREVTQMKLSHARRPCCGYERKAKIPRYMLRRMVCEWDQTNTTTDGVQEVIEWELYYVSYSVSGSPITPIT